MDTTTAATPPTAPPIAPVGIWRGPNRATTIGAVALVSVFAFEAMAVTTAMPVVAAALDGLSLYGLAFGGAVAASVVGMVVAGIVSDRRGPTVPFTAGAWLFAAGLLIAGLAPAMWVVVLGRAVQGTGIGLAIVTLYVLVDTYPDEQQTKVFAAFAAAWVVPALVGPALAGALAEHLHWRAVFLVVLVVAAPGAVLVGRRMRALPPRPAQDLDRRDRRRIRAAVVAALGAGLLHLAGQATQVAVGLALLAPGVVAIASSLRHLLPRGTARLARGLPTVVALRGVAAAGFFSAEVLLPLLLTTQRGLSTGRAGMVLTGGAVGWSIGSHLQGRFARPAQAWLRDGFVTLLVGLSLVGSLVVGQVVAGAPQVHLAIGILGWLVSGLGMGMIIPTLSVQVLRLSDASDQGGNVSSLQVSDALASGAAIALTGTLIAIGGAEAGVFAGGLALSLTLATVGLFGAGRVARPAR